MLQLLWPLQGDPVAPEFQFLQAGDGGSARPAQGWRAQHGYVQTSHGQRFDEQLPLAMTSSAVGAAAGKSLHWGAKYFPAPKTVVAPALWAVKPCCRWGEAAASCGAGGALATKNKLATQTCYAILQNVVLVCGFFFFFFKNAVSF